VCRVGGRSQRAATMLAEAGYRDVFNLEGGMAAWRQSEREPATPVHK
jgi:rhodanese-related sulfurtransferase